MDTETRIRLPFCLQETQIKRETNQTTNPCLSLQLSGPVSGYSSYHLLICFQGNLEDVSLLSLGKEEKHGLGFVCGWADEDHAPLWIIQVILSLFKKKRKS